MSRLRLWLKDFIVWIGFGDRLIEYCEVCGVRVWLVWWSPDDLWTEMTGAQPVKGDNMPGLLCPHCFDKRAYSRGVLLRWVPEVGHRKVAGEWETVDHTNSKPA